MITHKTKSGEIVLVEVPERYHRFTATLYREPNGTRLIVANHPVMMSVKGYDLGEEGEFEILGTMTKEDYKNQNITEEQAAELVDEVKVPRVKSENIFEGEIIIKVGYADYVDSGHYFDSALDSLRSLIESYKLNPDKVVIITTQK